MEENKIQGNRAWRKWLTQKLVSWRPKRESKTSSADHVTPSGSPLSSAETLEVSHVYVHRLILGVLQLILEQISLLKASA